MFRIAAYCSRMRTAAVAPSWLHRAPPILHELVLCLLCVRPTGQEAAKRGLARGGGGWSRDEPEAGAHEGGSPSPPARFRPPQTLHHLQRSERKTRRRRDGNGQPPAETEMGRVEPGGPHTQLRRCGSSERDSQGRRCGRLAWPTRSESRAGKQRDCKARARVGRPPPRRVDRRATGCSQVSTSTAYRSKGI